MDKEKLIQFYVEQYREVSRNNKKKNVNGKHYQHKINAKAKSIEKAVASPNQGKAVTLLHQDVKKLAFLAYYFNNKKSIRTLNTQIIPHLVRMDLGLMQEKQIAQVDEVFLKKLSKEASGAICQKNLKDILEHRQEHELRQQIMSLVPSKPELEFAKTRNMKRHFVLHIGPTNSGKTYHALERLKQAQSGVYLGPLRLLALEVYENMKESGIACTMLTGQECIEDPDSKITASTVEMLDVSQQYEVAVIDEAQLIEDEDRGHSWTRAILGVMADEVHVCMSPVAEEVIVHLIELCNDTYEIHKYERKTDLQIEDDAFEFPKDVQEGDAFIVFSKKSVLNIVARLEEQGWKASVIYGSLPPEIRRKQMNMFNSGETKIVVSTDAIGMGLNLPVRRIVFLEMDKFDGVQRRHLDISEVKQIAGRAGRYGKFNTGYVTAMGKRNLNYLKKLYTMDELMIDRVSLGFPQVLLDMEAPLDVILNLWQKERPSAPFEKINIDEMLFLYKEASRNQKFIADFEDKHMLYRMITCPVDIKDRELISQWRRYCMSYTADVELEKPVKRSRYEGLMRLESYYKKLDLYYQLSVRLGKWVDYEWLESEREKVQDDIMQMLAKDKDEYILRCRYCGKILPIGSKFNICDSCFVYR